MSKGHNCIFFLSGHMDNFLGTLQEWLVVSSLVLLETIDRFAKSVTASDIIEVAKGGVAKGHGGPAPAFPHKIITVIAKQKHQINQFYWIGSSCYFLI
jgi:hypothetical protein